MLTAGRAFAAPLSDAPDAGSSRGKSLHRSLSLEGAGMWTRVRYAVEHQECCGVVAIDELEVNDLTKNRLLRAVVSRAEGPRRVETAAVQAALALETQFTECAGALVLLAGPDAALTLHDLSACRAALRQFMPGSKPLICAGYFDPALSEEVEITLILASQTL